MLSKFSDKKNKKSKYCDTIECNSFIFGTEIDFFCQENPLYTKFLENSQLSFKIQYNLSYYLFKPRNVLLLCKYFPKVYARMSVICL